MSTQLAQDPPPFRPGSAVSKVTSTFYSFTANSAWAPAINLYETEQAYLVCVELAGVHKDKIDVELNGSLLTLSGNRTVPTEFDPDCLAGAETLGGTKRCKVHVMEIDHGAFTRTVELPSDADRDAVTARYREGFLWINVPKAKTDA